MQLSCPTCDHSFAFSVPLIADTPRRVRCPACAGSLSVRLDAAGHPQVVTLDTAPAAPPAADEVTGDMETPVGFGDDTRVRKRTVIEGPVHRENISGLHPLAALSVGPPSSQAPEPSSAPSPRAVTTGPRVILGASVRSRVAVHANATVALDTVRDLEAIERPTELSAPPPAAPAAGRRPQRRDPPAAPVRIAPAWAPAVDTEVTHEPSRVTPLPSRTLAWGLGAAIMLVVLVGSAALVWLWLTPGADDPVARATQGEIVNIPRSSAKTAPSSVKTALAGVDAQPAAAPSASAPATDEAPSGDLADAHRAAAVAPIAAEPLAAEPLAAADEPPSVAPIRRAATHEVFDTSDDTAAPWLALRRHTNRRSKLLAEMPDDTALRVLRRRGMWWRVRIIGGEDDGLEGWAHKRWIRRTAP